MKSTGPECQELTLWPEGTLANPLATPESDAARKTPATSGPCSLSAFAWYDPDTHCWRTSQGTLLSGSDLFSQTWPRSGMTHNGTAYQRPPSAPRTSAIEYSLSQGTHGPNSDGLWPTATTADHGTRYAQGGMPLGMAARMWPTPQAGDSKRPKVRHYESSQMPMLGGTIAERHPEDIGGSLNPTWVEWLMGFPVGWTDLED